jgi:hypothetical protein
MGRSRCGAAVILYAERCDPVDEQRRFFVDRGWGSNRNRRNYRLSVLAIRAFGYVLVEKGYHSGAFSMGMLG